jgi:hypothetical protein
MEFIPPLDPLAWIIVLPMTKSPWNLPVPATSNLQEGEVVPIPTLPEGNTVKRGEA